MNTNRIDPGTLGELETKVVTIKRVTKVVKGGKNMKFTALVVVGDKNGHVGFGLGGIDILMDPSMSLIDLLRRMS